MHFINHRDIFEKLFSIAFSKESTYLHQFHSATDLSSARPPSIILNARIYSDQQPLTSLITDADDFQLMCQMCSTNAVEIFWGKQFAIIQLTIDFCGQ